MRAGIGDQLSRLSSETYQPGLSISTQPMRKSYLLQLKFLVSFLRGPLTNHDTPPALLPIRSNPIRPLFRWQSAGGSLDARPSYQPRCDFRQLAVDSNLFLSRQSPVFSRQLCNSLNRLKRLSSTFVSLLIIRQLVVLERLFLPNCFFPSAIAVFVGISLVTRLDPDRESAARPWSIYTIWRIICKRIVDEISFPIHVCSPETDQGHVQAGLRQPPF